MFEKNISFATYFLRESLPNLKFLMTMKNVFFLAAVVLIIASCGNEPKKTVITDWQDIQKEMQTKLIEAEDGAVIKFPEGNFKFSGSLSLDGKNNITIKGAGIDKTVLSFAGQTDGAEGLKVNDCSNIRLEDFTIQDSKGDAIKTQKVHKITFYNIKAEWTGEPKEENGSYALYPVDCDSVLVDGCIAIGASDAGIYVGQSRDVIVKNSEAYHNVAGIEIENCIRADVFDNYSHENTGGILVFDMPKLTQNGREVRVFNNRIEENNYRNFAPEGNIVGEVPPGTGVMILATKDVEIFNNDMKKNNTIGALIVSYKLVKKTHNDENFNPYPKGIYIYDNNIERARLSTPNLDNDLGKLIMLKFPMNRPDIIFDGYLDPEIEQANGNYVAPYGICIGDNNGAKFAMVDAPNEFKDIVTDRTNYDCQKEKLPAVNL